MSTNGFINGSSLQAMLGGVPKYTINNYLSKSGGTQNGSLNLPNNNLYTYDARTYLGNQGDSLKAIQFNNTSSAANPHNFRISSNSSTNGVAFTLYDEKNGISPLSYNITNHKITTQCPWRQSGMTCTCTTSTGFTAANTSVAVPMTTVKCNYGTLLSQSGNGIKVATDCLVEVTVRVYLNALTKGDTYTVWLKESIGGTTVASSTLAGQSTKYMPIVIAPFLVKAYSGAVITCNVRNETSASGTIHTQSYMTVNVIGMISE